MNTSTELKGLAPEHLKTAYSRNWFRLFVKREFGGEEATLTEAMQALFDAAEIDGSLGWCVNLGSGASYFSGFLSPLAVKELLGDPKSVFAGSGQFGRAKKIETNYKVSGSWPRCTGSAHATSFTLNAELYEGVVLSFVIPKEKVNISNTWSLIGLENSSTYQIEANDILIPETYAFSIGQLNEKTSYSIHSIPFEPFARCCMIASLLGMTKCFISKVKGSTELMSRTKVPPIVDAVASLITSSFSKAQTLAKDLEKQCAENIEAKELIDEIQLLVIATAAEIRLKINELYYAGGLIIADKKNPANSAFRDLLVAGQHNLFR